MTKKRPFLDEIHAVREQLLAESGGTLSGLVARLQSEQKASGRELLRTQRKVESAEATEGAVGEGESQSLS